MFLVGTQWRGWNGRLAVGIMADSRLAILELYARYSWALDTGDTDGYFNTETGVLQALF